ncbi:MAG: four helix bundle protein [Chitinophagales bacterium]
MGNFKKLRVWQDAVNLAANIYFVTRKKPFAQDYGLCGQIQKAAVSVASNIAEGDERRTDKEAIYFLNVAKGSSAEVITQLHIAHRIGYLNDKTFEKLEDQTEKIRASLKNLIKSKKKK